MNDLSLTILPEQPDDGPAIEKLYERTFGPGRFARTAYRLREKMAHRRDLSFTARIGTLLVGSVRLTPVRIGDTPAMLLGPLTVEPPFREHGIGRSRDRGGQQGRRRRRREARAAGRRRALLQRLRLQGVPRGKVTLPGPVDPNSILIAG